jgi:predicted neuraminidase
VSVADGGGKTCFNPVLVRLKGGDIQIYYCSPNIDTGQVITSGDNGYTWSRPRQLPKGFVGPIVNKPVYMDNGTIIAGSSLQGKPGKRIHVERSTDNGKTWTKIGPISDPTNTKYEIIQPTILVHSQKRLQILARTNEKHKNARLAQTWSEDGGLTWSPVTDATLPNNNAAIDAVTLDDGRHLLVHNHSTREDPIGGRKGRGILTVAVTKDGINWKAAAVLEYRIGSVQYSYPSVIQTRDGLVHVSYSWHRKRIKHVVIDPKRLETYPIVDGQWPKDKMPWIKSEDPTKFVDYMKVENNINTLNQAMSVGASAESDKNTNTLKLDSIDPRDFLLRYTPADESTANRYRQYMIKELGEFTFRIEGTGVARTINKTVVVPPNVSYDGKGERLTTDAKAMLSNLSDQSEDQRPLFLLAPGAGIKNVTITDPGCEGIHTMGDNVLDNIHWGDVGKDAASVRSYFSGGKITIKNSKAFKASDKMFQFNTSCSVRIENFVGDDMGKLVRHMGSQDVPFHIDLNNVKVTNVVNAVVQSGSRKCHVRYHNLSYKFKGNKDKPERVFRCIPPENVTEY